MNQCTFLGRMTRDPEIRTSSSGMTIANFSIAVDRRRSADSEQEVDFFNCVAFDKRAEFIEKYLRSGMRVLVSGEMRNNNYTNKSGDKVYGMVLNASQIEFADGRREKEEQPSNASQTTENSSKNQQKTQADSSGMHQRTDSHQASGRGTEAKRTNARTKTSATAGFMNVPEEADEEGLPFN